jgi:hypothetical protein
MKGRKETGNVTTGARNLSDELRGVELGYVWLDRDRRDLKSICQN